MDEDFFNISKLYIKECNASNKKADFVSFYNLQRFYNLFL